MPRGLPVTTTGLSVSVPINPSSVTVPTLPTGSTVTVPSTTVTVPSTTVSVPSTTVTVPSTTVTVPGVTTTVPISGGSGATTPAPSPAPGSSKALPGAGATTGGSSTGTSPQAGNVSGTHRQTTKPKAKAKPKPFRGVGLSRLTLVVRRGVTVVRVSCPAQTTGRCTGSLGLETAAATSTARRSKPRVVGLGSATFSVRPGRTVALKVRLSGGGRHLIAARRSLRVRERARARDAGGQRRTSSVVAVMRRA